MASHNFKLCFVLVIEMVIASYIAIFSPET